MKKAVRIVAGVVVVAAVAASAGAWYTGTRLQPVLEASIAQANAELAKSMPGADGKPVAHIDLASLDRHFFSSTAHYRLTIDGQSVGADEPQLEFLFVDDIEHGPLPLSRLKALKLMPVMARSNYRLEPSPAAQGWFDVAKGKSPLFGHVNIAYDGATDGALELLALDFIGEGGHFSFSGMSINGTLSADGEKYSLKGAVDDYRLAGKAPEGDVLIGMKGFTFDTGGTRGASGFYLGHSDMKLGAVDLQLPGQPALKFTGTTGSSLMQEVEGKLAVEMTYDIAGINVAAQDVGSARMAWKFNNFETASTRALYDLYQTRIAPQQQAATAAGQPFELKLSDTEQRLLNEQMVKLLAAKPHVELQAFTLKTANGESRLNMALDLTNPGSVQPGSPQFAQNIIGKLDAKLLVSKPMLQDVGAVQARMQGQTDPAAIARQGKDLSDTAAAMAQMLQLAKDEGDNIVASLQYADGMVDFNGQKMTVQQFVASMMGRFGG
jgi:uncharacterized protein YdgA (DUF945 family)